VHFLLLYKYAPDALERRPAFRGAHFKLAREYVAGGELLLGGAFADPVDGAVLLFSAPAKDLVEEFARIDPYVTGGLVTEWTVREWTTVLGAGAAHPLPPGV
jgi:uncharacterized protein